MNDLVSYLSHRADVLLGREEISEQEKPGRDLLELVRTDNDLRAVLNGWLTASLGRLARDGESLTVGLIAALLDGWELRRCYDAKEVREKHRE